MAHLDYKATVWIKVQIDEETDVAKVIKNLKGKYSLDPYGAVAEPSTFVDIEYNMGSEEFLPPEENDGQATVEVYNDENVLIYTNEINKIMNVTINKEEKLNYLLQTMILAERVRYRGEEWEVCRIERDGQITIDLVNFEETDIKCFIHPDHVQINLLVFPELIPENVNNILERLFPDGDASYDACRQATEELDALGYDTDYGLDGTLNCIYERSNM